MYNFIHIYGDSDDLIELEGAITDEFGALDGGTLTLTAPNGKSLNVECIFHRLGAWVIAPVPSEGGNAGWEMTTRFGLRTPGEFAMEFDKNPKGRFIYPVTARAATYTTVLSVNAPEGTTATFVSYGLGGM